MKKINRYLLISVLLGALIMSSCEKPITDDDSGDQQFCIPDSLMKNITFDTVRTESVTSELKLTGKITFNEDHVVKVYPIVGGHISDVKVTLGDHVEKGQLLAVVNSSDMAGYSSDYKTTKSELAIAKKNLEVTTELKSSGVSSDKDMITAQNEYQKALSAFNKMNEVMKIYGSTGGDSSASGSGFYIKAPISGFIVEKNVNTGMELRADESNSLFTISDLKDLWAVANVYETDIAKIKEGNIAEVRTLSYPDKKFSAKVERVSNILNPETNSMSVKIHLDNPDYLLKPGMFANISILFPENDKMLVVPSRTILYDDNKSYVVVFSKRCDVDLQQVNILKSYNDMSYIQSDSVQVGNLVIDRNGLFVFTALKKL